MGHSELALSHLLGPGVGLDVVKDREDGWGLRSQTSLGLEIQHLPVPAGWPWDYHSSFCERWLRGHTRSCKVLSRLRWSDEYGVQHRALPMVGAGEAALSITSRTSCGDVALGD